MAQTPANRHHSTTIRTSLRRILVGQFLRDLDDVIERVRRRFNTDKVVLLGHSWGTVLGTIYTYQHPQKVAAYVGVAQIANVSVGNQLSYAFALSEAVKRQCRSAIAALHEIGPPARSVSAGLTLGKWVERFGGVFHTDLSTGKLIRAALMTDEASLVDLVKFGQGNRFSLKHLWGEFSQVDLTRYQTFDVPIFFAFLFEHQLQEKFRYLYTWTEGDVLVWDHLGTIHRAVADYGPDEHRLMKRCQVMATKIFEPEFLQLVAREPVSV